MKPTRLLLAGAMLAGLTLSQTGANAAVLVAYPGNALTPYHPVATQAGTAVTYLNADATDEHNVLSVATGKVVRSYCTTTQTNAGTCPLFKTKMVVAAGESVTVDGTDKLAAGSYDFFCTFHGNAQKGTLTVL